MSALTIRYGERTITPPLGLDLAGCGFGIAGIVLLAR
jgi:hypothetical protein